jgi:hypothetical protein
VRHSETASQLRIRAIYRKAWPIWHTPYPTSEAADLITSALIAVLVGAMPRNRRRRFGAVAASDSKVLLKLTKTFPRAIRGMSQKPAVGPTAATSDPRLDAAGKRTEVLGGRATAARAFAGRNARGARLAAVCVPLAFDDRAEHRAATVRGLPRRDVAFAARLAAVVLPTRTEVVSQPTAAPVGRAASLAPADAGAALLVGVAACLPVTAADVGGAAVLSVHAEGGSEGSAEEPQRCAARLRKTSNLACDGIKATTVHGDRLSAVRGI